VSQFNFVSSSSAGPGTLTGPGTFTISSAGAGSIRFAVNNVQKMIFATGDWRVSGDNFLAWTSSTSVGTGDTYIGRRAAASIQLGNIDAAAPVAQTLGVQGVLAGTTNTAGSNFTINGSQGTGTGAGGSILFQTAPVGSSGTAQNALVTAMDITGAGNVGIGTTAPSYLLHVGSASASGAVAGFQNSADLCTLTPASSTPTWSCSSDVRLKTDIADSGDALARFDDMRVRDFTMNATGERQTGVIAQELATVHPGMVRMGSNGFYTVDSPNPWMLVKAIQELKAENDNLRARLDALEAKQR